MKAASKHHRKHVNAALFVSILASVVAGCTTVVTPPALETVESGTRADGDPLARFRATIHVVLQVHEHPNQERRAAQNQEALAVCQENVVAIVSKIAATGVRAVVIEGLFAAGTLAQPQRVPQAQVEEEKGSPKAKWILAERPDLSVYGFELKPLNDFGVTVVDQFGRSIADARELELKENAGISEQEQREYNQLIQDEVTRLNLWYAGVIPQRSFLALQTALAVALARRENQVQLVIGKQHWSDLVYAVNRHPDVHIRLIPYPCEAAGAEN